MANIINIGGAGGGGGTSVVPNPQGTATDTLVKLGIEGTIYDFAGGSAGHNYTTTEQVIGTWTDGSTLYEKTLYFNNKKLTTNESTSELEHNISNIGSVKFVESAYIDFDYGTWVTAINCIAAGTLYPVGWVVTTTKIYVRCSTGEFSAAANRSYLITVRYTKSSS